MTIAPVQSSQSRGLTSSGSRAVVLRRAAALANELQKAARAARLSKAATPWRSIGFVRGARDAAVLWADSRRWLLRSFVAIVAIPSLLSVIYFSLIASNRYVTEARFAVRAGEVTGIDSLATITGLGSLQQAQDSLIVTDYLKSRAIVEELEKSIGLRQLFSREDIDYVSRFDAAAPIEDLVWYWRWWRVKTAIEMPSGIISVEVNAFTPADSLKIADSVVALSERLINDMSARAARDLLAQSDLEVKRAEDRLRRARAALRDLRNEEGILDPKAQGEGINRVIETIRLERLKMEQELSTVTRTLSDQAPQVQILRSRIHAANEQIALLESQLTAPVASVDRTVSRALMRFDELELERQVAEKQYTAALAGLEAARVNAERQKMYLTTFVRPVLATDATYPKRFWYSAVAILCALLAWALFVWIVTVVRERLSQ
jgi:capsular polysaccharide transport system permease protein